MQHSLQYRYDMSTFYKKIMRDIAAAQMENGCVPTIAPEFVKFQGGFGDTPEWGSTSVLSPLYYYKWYGDSSLMARQYPVMKRYVSYLGSRADSCIVAYGLGDWYDIGPERPGYAQLTSNALTATAIYYSDVKAMEQAASVLGYDADAQGYARLASDIKDAYNTRFYNKERGSYDRDSQTANAISLAAGLVEEGERDKVLGSLVRDIEGRGYALTAGDVGYRYVLAALTEGNRADIVFKMNDRYDTPGYGWQIAHGATALTESWQAYDFSSNNHFMLGHIMEWFFSALGGIRQADESVGFKTIDIHPLPCGDLKSVSTSFNSPYGTVESSWKLLPGRFVLDLEIPANTTARVWLPSADENKISEHGLALKSARGIHSTESVGEATVVKIGSGKYKFDVTL